MNKVIFLLLSLLLFAGCTSDKPIKGISKEEKKELLQYLKTHWKTPEDYVVDKFSNHDIVIIGESHRIKHDVELIHNLIPLLYKNGIYNLGMEFGCYEYQAKVDSLITSDTYDENLARWLMFKDFVGWGYKEYMDIYRKAWELNKSLPKEAPRFRVVNLVYRANWSALKEKMTPALWKKVWFKGNYDEHMAQVVLKEFVNKGQKALIYCGIHHAFTRYQQPYYDEKKKLINLITNRMGNILYQKIPDKIFLVYLHAPWPTKDGFDYKRYPVQGVIDKLMQEFKDQRVGFDVKESPFGRLKDDTAYYSLGHENFTLSNFCDGYIFQKQFRDYQGCSVDTLFITKENFQEAIENIPDWEARKRINSPETFIKGMQEDADFKRLFRGLK